jgi:hypothetical protein
MHRDLGRADNETERLQMGGVINYGSLRRWGLMSEAQDQNPGHILIYSILSISTILKRSIWVYEQFWCVHTLSISIQVSIYSPSKNQTRNDDEYIDTFEYITIYPKTKRAL